MALFQKTQDLINKSEDLIGKRDQDQNLDFLSTMNIPNKIQVRQNEDRDEDDKDFDQKIPTMIKSKNTDKEESTIKLYPEQIEKLAFFDRKINNLIISVKIILLIHLG